MEVIADIIRNVVLTVLFAAFLQMLVPQEGFGRYLNFIMGLFVLVAILNPLLPYLAEKQIDISAWQPIASSETATILENGKRLQQTNEGLALEKYRQGLSDQIETLVNTVDGVGKAKVDVLLAENSQRGLGAIEEVQLIVYPEQSAEEKNVTINIDPVQIGTVLQPEQSDGSTDLVQKIEQSLINAYNLDPQRLHITIISQGEN